MDAWAASKHCHGLRWRLIRAEEAIAVGKWTEMAVKRRCTCRRGSARAMQGERGEAWASSSSRPGASRPPYPARDDWLCHFPLGAHVTQSHSSLFIPHNTFWLVSQLLCNHICRHLTRSEGTLKSPTGPALLLASPPATAANRESPKVGAALPICLPVSPIPAAIISEKAQGRQQRRNCNVCAP